METQEIQSTVKTIDVVIPVYNAPELTKRCIDSIVAHLGKSIQRVLIQDDASGRETREMLDHLPYECVEVCHAERNQGFGLTVNAAVNRSNAFYVLILNSDTEVSQNILPQLCAAFDADDRLVAIIPAGNSYGNFDLSRYVLREGNYVQTYYLRGHAILIRRDAFLAVGGFDAAFGRGYYEDIDLGRRLDLNGWHFGVHPNVHIYHKGAGSFGEDRIQLARRNRAMYLSRYPQAQQNILLLSGNCALADFSEDFLVTIERRLRAGGSVHWFSPIRPSRLICLQMYGYASRLRMILKILSSGWRRADRRVTEIWIMPRAPLFPRWLLMTWAKWHDLKILMFKETAAQDPYQA